MEMMLFLLNNLYFVSKVSLDLFVMFYVRIYKFFVIIMRCSNNYGFYQYYEKMILIIIRYVVNGMLVLLYGDGMQIRDWLFVEDYCCVIKFVLEKGMFGEIYNIGGGNEWMNKDLVVFIMKEFGVEEWFVYVEDRKGYDCCYVINVIKLK